MKIRGETVFSQISPFGSRRLVVIVKSALVHVGTSEPSFKEVNHCFSMLLFSQMTLEMHQLLHCARPSCAVILSHLAWKFVEPFSQTIFPISQAKQSTKFTCLKQEFSQMGMRSTHLLHRSTSLPRFVCAIGVEICLDVCAED